MRKLDEFTRAYLECMLWAETDNSDERGGDPLDKNYTPEDINDASLKQAVADGKRFQQDNSMALAVANYDSTLCSDTEMAGHDFWLTRNGHGAGFWDGDLDKDVGKVLTEACKGFGECSPYVADGKVHFS